MISHNLLRHPFRNIAKPVAEGLVSLLPDVVAPPMPEKHAPAQQNERRAVVIYDSLTGSTWKVAKAIAEGLDCETMRITDVSDLSCYELVVFGSPSVDKRPTAAIYRFLRTSLDRPPMIAFFCTFDVPILGRVRSQMCLDDMATACGRKPIDTFCCPGSQLGSRNCGNRPGMRDKTKAFQFGLRLANRLGRR